MNNLTNAQKAGALAALCSAALLAGVLVFQYGFDLPPCPLCIQQRYPHGAALILGLGAFFTTGRVQLSFALLAAAALSITGGIGAYHAGVEFGWWAGPNGCTGVDGAGAGSVDDLLSQIEGQSVIRCDEAPWTLFNISLAGYNAIISFGTATLVTFLSLKK